MQVATAITALEGRLKGIQKSGERPLTDKEELALRLNKQYPQDVGVLSAFFLNLVKLQAGQVCASVHVSADGIAGFAPARSRRVYLRLCLSCIGHGSFEMIRVRGCAV